MYQMIRYSLVQSIGMPKQGSIYIRGNSMEMMAGSCWTSKLQQTLLIRCKMDAKEGQGMFQWLVRIEGRVHDREKW